MVAIIDGDSILYALGWVYKDAWDDEFIKRQVRERLSLILDYAQADQFVCFLKSKTCFRQELYKVDTYKGNRLKTAKPEWYLRLAPAMTEVLVNEYGAISKEGYEADDLCSIVAFALRDQSIVCSPDKDLKQIPGMHMDIREEEPVIEHISDEEAKRWFWKQMMMGDSGDNIKGVPKLGTAKADAILNKNPPETWHEVVEDQYILYYGEEVGRANYTQTFYTLLLVREGHIKYDKALEEELMTYIRPITVNQ